MERNLPYLITYAPVMPAPRRDMNLPEPTGTLAASLVKGKNPEGMVRFEGSLERDGGMPVYLISAGQAYEAFLMKDSSFTALLPEEMQPEAVAFYRDGELRLFQVQ